MSWDCGCGEGWSMVLVGWLGLKAMYLAFVCHFLSANERLALLASLVAFGIAVVAVLS